MLIELEELKRKVNNSKYYGTDAWRDILDMAAECEDKNAPIIEPCEDAISREWIKDYCKKQIDHYEMRKKRILSEKAISYNPKEQIEGFEDEITIYKWILREVDKLPSVAPNRPSGEWVVDDKGYFSCSECGRKPKYQNETSEYSRLQISTQPTVIEAEVE